MLVSWIFLLIRVYKLFKFGFLFSVVLLIRLIVEIFWVKLVYWMMFLILEGVLIIIVYGFEDCEKKEIFVVLKEFKVLE